MIFAHFACWWIPNHTAPRPVQAPFWVRVYSSTDCTGTELARVDVANTNENECTSCWDRCARLPGQRIASVRLESPGTGAIGFDCVGRFPFNGKNDVFTITGTTFNNQACFSSGGGVLTICGVTDFTDSRLDGLLADFCPSS